MIRSARMFCQLPLLPLGPLIVAATLCIGLFVSAQMVLWDDRTPVLSLATLQSELQRDPAAWLGRVVRVRAVAVQCQVWFNEPDSCFQWQPSLIDALDATTSPLPLVAGPAPSIPSWLRGLPIIAGLVRLPHPIHWGTPAIYTVHVQLCPRAVGSQYTCYEAMLRGVVL